MSDDAPYDRLPAITGTHPFRIGVTSYVYPADFLTNIRRLSGQVQAVQLLLYESDQGSNMPSPADILAMRDAAPGMTWIVHLPIDRKLGSVDPAERQAMLDQCLRVLELTAPLFPESIVLHVEGVAPDASRARVLAWQEDVFPLLDRLAAAVDDPARICLENIYYPFEWCDPFLARHPFGVCIDFGHLWEQGLDWRAHLAKYMPRTPLVHLYGPTPKSWHVSFAAVEPALRTEAMASLARFRGTLILETFSFEDTASSIEALNGCASTGHPA